jgi:transaldolase/glucose-6-phosphate isomerase
LLAVSIAKVGRKAKHTAISYTVEELVGPEPISTVPPATLDAFGDHGKLADTLEGDLDDSRRVLNELAGFNISLASVTEQLTQDGLRVFEDAAEKLLSAIARKRCALSPIDKLLKRHSGGDVHALPAAVGNPA